MKATAQVQSPQSQRLDWLDIAKGVAILAVIIGHTCSGPVRAFIFSFHMPLFFILAGYTFRAKTWKILLRQSVKRLLLPYILLVTIHLIPFFLKHWNGLQWGKTLRALVQIFVFPTGYPSVNWMDRQMWAGAVVDKASIGFYGVGMLWFLWALFLARILANAALSALNTVVSLEDSKAKHSVIVLCGSLVFLAVSLMISLWWKVYLPFEIEAVFAAVALMGIGYLARAWNAVQSRRLVFLIIALVIWVLAIRYSSFEMSSCDYKNPVLAYAGAVAGTYVISLVAFYMQRLREVPVVKVLPRFFVWTGKNSLQIYCIHSFDSYFLDWKNLSITSYPFAFASLMRILFALVFFVALTLIF